MQGFLYLQMGEENMAWTSGNLQLITTFFTIQGDLMENRTIFLRVRVITENRIHILKDETALKLSSLSYDPQVMYLRAV